MSAPQRLDLSYAVAWDGRWHVGSGHGTALADRLVRRRGGPHGTPFVPGAQVKGVLRHACERLAGTLGCPVLDPHAGDEPRRAALAAHHVSLDRSDLLVDRLFGTRYQGDCLFVEDALPAGPAVRADLTTRVALDRVTGTAREQHLFVTEVSDGGGLELRSRLRARHPAGVLTQDGDGFPYEYALLVAALRGLDALGGDKSAGLGRCRLTLAEDVRWNDTPLSADELDSHLQACFAEDDWRLMVQMLRGEA
jgi:CRISPR/Cas system CSM-associated protein Csm3 (group 7 of RAMP superfamily)